MMGIGGRVVVVRPQDINQKTAELLPDAKPEIIGEALPLRRMGFCPPPKVEAKYAHLNKKAFEIASARCAKDPFKSIVIESQKVLSELIEQEKAKEAQPASSDLSTEEPSSRPLDGSSASSPSKDSAASHLVKRPKRSVRLSRSKPPSQRVSDKGVGSMPNPISELSELFEEQPMPGHRSRNQVPRRPAGQFDQSPSLEWPSAASPEDLDTSWPEQTTSAHWLDIDGLGPEPVPPAFAARYSSGNSAVVIPCGWLFENSSLDGSGVESIVVVYDKRWDGKSYSSQIRQMPRSGTAKLQVADIIDGKVSAHNVDRFDVADVAIALDIGDLGIVIFFPVA
ncbi:MAG: hypothetical protein KatS3mg109_0156 [Pirellulaceae bacterium]|nr:MAG: hypothetical protein KatS3mg109_0156 [Pirellulaceae bacterium]